MSDNNNRIKSSDSESTEERIGERKRWMRFEEQTKDEVYVSISDDISDGKSDGKCATIEPSNSIQMINPSENINNIPDSNKRSSSSPVSSVLPQRIQSNHGSNKTIINSIVDNKENIQSFGESSTQSSLNKTLQNIPLKDSNNRSEQNQCNHSSTPNGVYSNGDVIVTLLPLNQSCSWLTPAAFKPELVPEELMAQSLSLTVEDYVTAMQVLTNDLRFNLYITLYKRILVIWIALGFIVLLALLFSGVKGLALFGGGVLWLIINALGIFATMWIKIKLYHLLERCISHVNGMLYKYNILVGVDDRGKISCHKINLVFIYFDVTYCIKFLKDMLENDNQTPNTEQATNRSNLSFINPSHLDIDTSDIVITGPTPKSLSQKEKYAEKLLLRYSQRWVKDFVRRRIDLNLPLHADAAGVNVTALPSNPRHCISSRCLCQFIEEHLKFKPLTQCNITELFM
jgi:hypothetical protein